MNLLARILSHGFALAVVVLIAITLMYRGDLFQEWKLPDFLVIEDKSNTGTDAPAGTAEPVPSESVAVSADAGVMAPAEPPAVEVVEDVITQDVVIQEEVTPAEASVADAAPDSDPAVDPDTDTDTDPAVDPDTDADADADTDAGDVDAVQEASPEVSAPESVDSSPEASEAVSSDVMESTLDETGASDIQEDDTARQTDQPAQDDASSISSAATDAVSEQVEIPAPEMAVSPPVAEQVVDPVPAPSASEIPPAVSPEMAVSPPVIEQVVDPAPTPLAYETPPAVAQDETGKSAYELLAAAREAYWLHDYEQAEKYYQQLIQADPDNPDGYGELGNMHFAQGQWEPAAAAYYEAGVRLLNTGMVVQARQLVDVIRGLNGTQADDLERQVEAAK